MLCTNFRDLPCHETASRVESSHDKRDAVCEFCVLVHSIVDQRI